jgi:hypothetical protein
MKKEFVIAHVEPGKLNALVKNIMLQTGIENPNEAVRLFNSGELIAVDAVPDWERRNNLFYFSVTSPGRSGPEWIEYFRNKGTDMNEDAKKIILSADFQSTKGITTGIVVASYENFVDVSSLGIHQEAICKYRMIGLSIEQACLIRDKMTDRKIQKMGFDRLIFLFGDIDNPEGKFSCLGMNTFLGDNNLFGSILAAKDKWQPTKIGFCFGHRDYITE